jgi:putative acetyltransferase
LVIREDDLTGPEIVALLERHRAEAVAQTEPQSAHALAIDGLRAPEVTVWTVWSGDVLVGCGALKQLAPDHGEIKSMHTVAEHRGRGVASRLLTHIIARARQRGYRRVSLETGSMAAFAAAQALYAKAGFTPCPPFAQYREDPNSVYRSLDLTADRVPANIDHLLYAVPDLEEGCGQIEALLGIRPVRGGRHPAFGTHNALLALGSSVYLEVIAADPALPRPPRGVLLGLDALTAPRLARWVLRPDDLDAAVAGRTDLGPIEAGQRQNPDGSVVAWRFTDPYATSFDGAMPFLIDWGSTPHPGTRTPSGGELTGFRLEHPEPDRLSTALVTLDADVAVGLGPATRLVATISTPRGVVELA